MLVSHSWLKKYVDFKYNPEDLAKRLTMLGLEVERIERLGEKYDKFVVGEVLEKSKHPNADRLTLCTVNIGRERLSIVCGAPNVEAGQKVAVALVGATIPRNQHDPNGRPFTLMRANIRGLESDGMICSEYELDLGSDADGILVLDPKAKVGTSLATHLGRTDTVYEISVTPNRGDWLSHIGVAREIALANRTKIKKPAIKIRESSILAAKHIKVKILDRERCPRYSARLLKGVKVEPSPKWLQDTLTAVGIRPINNIVDITNYVLMETGQPLHAFDYEKLSRQTIIVRTAAEGDTFTTLDGKERELRSDTLMICDGDRTIAIAGVMGGANSEITESTTNVLIESANFEPRNIRRTSRFLNLSTDASQRFERGVDVEMTTYAANRAAQLIQELTGAEVLRGVVDAYPKKIRARKVKVRLPRVNAILGTSLTRAEIVSLLKPLEIVAASAAGDVVTFSIPSFRNDLVEEIDIIEEVGRAYGYDNIETKTHAEIEFLQRVQADTFWDDLRDYLIGAGFRETLTISLQDRSIAQLAGQPVIDVLNPVSADMSSLRTSLIPGALATVRHNVSRGQEDLRLFEIGHVFSRSTEGPIIALNDLHEEERVLLLLTGDSHSPRYGVPERSVDFFDLKGEVENLLSKFSLDKHRFISYDSRSPLTEYQLRLEINGTYGGFLGKISKQILSRFEIEQDVFVCELVGGVLADHLKQVKQYVPLPKFPSVRRDLALVVDLQTSNGQVESALKESGEGLLSGVVLFDVYVGEQIGTGKKSLAYALEFQPRDRTYTDREIDAVVARMLDHVENQCNAKLRS